MGDFVEKILRDVGLPLPRAKLFEAVKVGGMIIHGKDPEMVFSTMLWRMQDRFIRLEKHGYWLRNVPNPAVGYDPRSRGPLN